MAVCKFWLGGNCRFGDRCRYQHEEGLDHGDALRERRGPAQGGQANSKFGLDEETIRNDFTTDRPMWILSSYGLGRNLNFLGGFPRERSFEEMRLLHYEMSAYGNMQQAISEAQLLQESALQHIKTVLNDPQLAVSYIAAAANEHPNRIDHCNGPTWNPSNKPDGRGMQSDVAGPGIEPSPMRAPSLTSALQSPRQPLPFSSNPFAKPQAPAPFGQSSSLGQGPAFKPQTGSNPFATTRAAQEASATPMGVPNQRFQPSQLTTQAGIVQPAPQRLGNAAPPQGWAGHGGKTGSGARLASWKGRAVSYINEEPCFKGTGGAWERIWFPDPPQWKKETGVPEHAYDAGVEAAWADFGRDGAFKDIMPEVPPKREWCSWDF